MGTNTGPFRPLPPLAVQPGQVLELPAGSRMWFPEAMRLRVTAVRLDISTPWDGEAVWLEGDQLDGQGRPARWTQELVRVTALPAGPLPARGGSLR
jgi:hypothetical protein